MPTVAAINLRVRLTNHMQGISKKDSKKFDIGLGRCMLVSLLLEALGLRDSHIPTFWILRCQNKNYNSCCGRPKQPMFGYLGP